MGAAGIIIVIAVAGATYLLADALDAVDAQVDEIFGDVVQVPDGLAAPPESQAGSGHVRGSAACEDRTRHGEGSTP